ncbi:coiled-coil domain-containing protein 27-like isoform X2 [Heptranchias perlo]|uniref:coiled-coil domain-containing protein 27-like isoform X2 n=1 Tax=Heptranchias perlo TaxID=212740 RepID=UPI0035595CA2
MATQNNQTPQAKQNPEMPVRTSLGMLLCYMKRHLKETKGVNLHPGIVGIGTDQEKCVLMLEDKIKHLSVFEAESRRKDGVIAALRDEVAALTQQLSVTMDNDILRTQVQTILMLQDEIDCLKVFEAESQRKDCVIAGLREQIWQLGLQISQLNEDTSIHTTSTTREDISKHETKERELETESKISGTPVEKSSKEKLKEKGKEENSKKIVLNGEGQGEEDEHGREEKEVVEPEGESPSKPESVDHDKDNNLAMEDEKLKELTNLISQNEELKKQLTEMKEGYNMSTGAVVSINRELSLAEAQLRNTEAEVERLQKDLKERCIQLQDMSNKFSNLKEENNHIKIMADLQKENFNFRELVSELQSGLKERNEVITGLKGEIDKLQLHITDGEVKLKRLQMECDDATTNGDFLQHELQQLQIALKFTGTRLERFVSKIIQAVYTTPGIVQPTVQISDDDTLDVFQKILDDRLEFHRLLTENGIAVPPLFVTENPDESQTAP